MKRTLTDIQSLPFKIIEPKTEVKGKFDLIVLHYQRGGKKLSRTIRRDTAIQAGIIQA